MTNRKNTKRALFSSVLALILCFSMLLGSTYAWFTDSASTAVNTIQAGTLKVDMVDPNGNSLKGQTLKFVNVDNKSDILWEPGATFKLEPFAIANKGNLALKYKFIINGIEGDAKLLDALEFSVLDSGNSPISLDTFEGNVLPNAAQNAKSGTYTLIATMDEDAGNEYQGLSVEGISITVLATQYTYEKDWQDDQYDAGAKYAEAPVAVATASELAEALIAGDSVDLVEDVEIADGTVINIPADSKVTINLNGNALIAEDQTSRPFNVANGTELTINAEGSEISTGAFGLVNVTKNSKAVVVLNGGTYTAETDNGAFIKVREGAEANIVLNNVNYEDESANGFLVNSLGGAATITVNGGILKAAYGIQGGTVNVANNATIDTKGFAIEVSGVGQTGKIVDSTIKTGSLAASDGAKAAGVQVGYAAVVHIENCVLDCALDFVCLPGSNANDGEIYASNCTGADTFEYQEGATGKIVIDGQLK